MPKLTLKRWRPGLEKITLTKMIQEKAGVSLTSAKDCVDRLLAGEEVSLDLPTSKEAAKLGEAIRALGVDCEVDT
jgi:ribosomal protein L7/L12